MTPTHANPTSANFFDQTVSCPAGKRAIANQTGRTSITVLRGYIRHRSLFTDNAASKLGL